MALAWLLTDGFLIGDSRKPGTAVARMAKVKYFVCRSLVSKCEGKLVSELARRACGASGPCTLMCHIYFLLLSPVWDALCSRMDTCVYYRHKSGCLQTINFLFPAPRFFSLVFKLFMGFYELEVPKYDSTICCFIIQLRKWHTLI